MLEGLVHYVICTRVIEQLMVMTIKLITLGHNVSRSRLNNTPDIVFTLNRFGQITMWNTSRLEWDFSLLEIYQSINRLISSMALNRM